MNKLSFLIITTILFLSGCATYSLKKGEDAPYHKGFIVTRYDRVIPEYTVGKDDSLPLDEQIARERFGRRRKKVEDYYKRMDYIENRFKQNFIDFPVFMAKSIIGLLRLPAIMINDYRYNHNPKYKERMDKLQDAEYQAEKARIQALKDRLNAYIQEDLKKEPVNIPAEKKPLASAIVAEKEIASSSAAKDSGTPRNDKGKPEKGDGSRKIEPSPFSPTVVVIAKPQKGPSPLIVQFNAAKSSSPYGRIVAYSWDFGDGDTSTKKNPANTYWSTTYGSRKYTATLTVKDEKGTSASASTEIEVINK